MIYKIQHTNKSKLWCGPAAVAAITGHTTDEIHRVMRQVSGRTRIAGVDTSTLMGAMSKLGYRLTKQVSGDSLSLAQWLSQNRALYAKMPFIVRLTSHYVVVCGRRFVDSHTKTPVALTDAPFRRARVQRAWTFEKVSTPQIPAKATNPHRKLKQDCRKLASLHGIEIDPVDDYWWVYPPDSLAEDSDPYTGDHICYDWPSVAKRVTVYAKLAALAMPIVGYPTPLEN